jgi:hypothetical protein
MGLYTYGFGGFPLSKPGFSVGVGEFSAVVGGLVKRQEMGLRKLGWIHEQDIAASTTYGSDEIAQVDR